MLSVNSDLGKNCCSSFMNWKNIMGGLVRKILWRGWDYRWVLEEWWIEIRVVSRYFRLVTVR